MFGKPDFVFIELKLAIFVDGCFWHGCPKHCNQPANNRAFWRRKLTANKARDRVVARALRRAGWRLMRVWEHELARKNQERLVRRLAAFGAQRSSELNDQKTLRSNLAQVHSV